MVIIGLIMLVAGIWSINATYSWFKRDYATRDRKVMGLVLTGAGYLLAFIGLILTVSALVS